MLWRGCHQEEEASGEAKGREEADEARRVSGHSPRSFPRVAEGLLALPEVMSLD